jgi:hypothetical protein
LAAISALGLVRSQQENSPLRFLLDELRRFRLSWVVVDVQWAAGF